MKKWLGLFAILLLCLQSMAVAAPKSKQGYVSMSEHRTVYYRYFEGSPKKPTLLLVNGLIYDLDNWNEFIQIAVDSGYSVISFAFSAQPESLRGLRGADPDFFKGGLSVEDLSDEVLAVYKATKKTGKVQLVTLSYGSVAVEFARAHRELVSNLILMAPLVVPSEQYDPNGKLLDFWLDGWRDYTRWVDPFGLWSKAWYEAAWETIYGGYLGQRMDSRGAQDPDYFPKGVSKEVYKKSIFHLVRAARDFDLRDYVRRELPTTHLMLASEEERPAMMDQLKSWEAMPAAQRGTLVYFVGAYHALAGAHPVESAEWLRLVLEGGKLERDGSYFLKLGEGRVMKTEYKDLKRAIEQAHR